MAAWTQEEELIVKRYYNATYNKQTLLDLLPGRTWNAIAYRASELGIKRQIKLLVKLIKYVKVDQQTMCWQWTGNKSKNGYAACRADGKFSSNFHRRVYEYFRGPITDHLHCHHICYNRSCVNPYHLELRTNQDNIFDQNSQNICNINRMKPACPMGHPYDEKNTYNSAQGRSCRECHKLRERKRRGRTEKVINNKDKTKCSKGHVYPPHRVGKKRRCRECEILKVRSQGVKPMNYWTNEQLEQLRLLYARATKEHLMQLFNRSWSGIEHKALRLGLRRRT